MQYLKHKTEQSNTLCSAEHRRCSSSFCSYWRLFCTARWSVNLLAETCSRWCTITLCFVCRYMQRTAFRARGVQTARNVSLLSTGRTLQTVHRTQIVLLLPVNTLLCTSEEPQCISGPNISGRYALLLPVCRLFCNEGAGGSDSD
jgi:hypothetical protein